MTKPREAPAWLEGYQGRFSAMLRTPLDRSSGTLRDRTAAYPAELCAEALGGRGLDAAERLAVYNRQYWFRLFTVMQHEYRLTTRLLGPWTLNGLAAQLLEARPPREHDLACAADGFAEFLEHVVPRAGVVLEREQRAVPKQALVQAARIDDAFRLVFRAPEQAAFAPSAADAARMEHARLRWSLAVRRVEEAWPLLALRDAAIDGERAVELPAPHPRPRQLMICRAPAGFRIVPLEPLAAQLMERLERMPLGAALAELEHSVPASDRATLPAMTQRWLADGMRFGYWTGLEP